ncbi:MAG: TolC family protein [Phocaeicola sp.]
MNRLSLILGVLSFVASPSFADSVANDSVSNASASNATVSEPMSLNECILRGVEKNFKILVRREKESIAKNNATLGNAGLLPSLEFVSDAPATFGDSYTTAREGENSSLKGQYTQELTNNLKMSWTLFDGLGAQATYAKLKDIKSQEELSTRIAIENLVAEIVTSYYKIVLLERKGHILDKSLELSSNRLNALKSSQALGLASKMEIQQAEVDYNSDRTKCIRQAEEIYRSKIELNKLIALDDVSQDTKVIHSEILFYPIGDKETLWSQVEASNAYLLSAEKDRKISKEELKIVKAKSYPYLKLHGGYEFKTTWYTKGTTQRLDEPNANVALTVGVTLFDGLNLRRQRNNAKLQIKIAELESQSLELSIKGDFSTLWMAYVNNKMLVDMERENVEIAGKYLELAMCQYKLRVMSGLQLREAQNNYLAAEDRLLNAEYEAKLCEISLLVLSGNILSVLL